MISGFPQSIPNNGADEISNSSADQYLIAGVPAQTKNKRIATVSLIKLHIGDGKIIVGNQQVFQLIWNLHICFKLFFFFDNIFFLYEYSSV